MYIHRHYNLTFINISIIYDCCLTIIIYKLLANMIRKPSLFVLSLENYFLQHRYAHIGTPVAVILL